MSLNIYKIVLEKCMFVGLSPGIYNWSGNGGTLLAGNVLKCAELFLCGGRGIGGSTGLAFTWLAVTAVCPVHSALIFYCLLLVGKTFVILYTYNQDIQFEQNWLISFFFWFSPKIQNYHILSQIHFFEGLIE